MVTHEEFKLIFLGDSGVGKTSAITRCSKDTFGKFGITIGADFTTRDIEVGGKIIQMQIWDTAGEERFTNVSPIYYRNAKGIFIVFDLTNENSFRSADKWIEDSKNYASEDASIILLGAKCDLTTNKTVNYSTAIQFAEARRIKYFEISSKFSINIDLAFFTMIKEIQSKMIHTQDKQEKNVNNQPENSSMCCIS